MPYNDAIPGWMPIIDLKTLELLAGRIPEGGIIVEVGSFKGRSSWTLAKSCHPSVTVYCIDLWDDTWKGKEILDNIYEVIASRDPSTEKLKESRPCDS